MDVTERNERVTIINLDLSALLRMDENIMKVIQQEEYKVTVNH